MRFLELRLERYGHFQDRVLDLSAKSRGLHVIHGANEAGKSTALRAILALLYGFPKQTPDDFRFAYKDLRVGARIETDDGRRLDVTRLKRDKNSLVDAGGAPIDEGALRALLGGVNRDDFVRMFGLDHDGLRKGGEELLEAGGALAESLFSSGLGGADVRGLREALVAESDALFGASARTRIINELVKKAESIKDEADKALLDPSDYENRSQRLIDATAKAGRLAEVVAARAADVERLKRRIKTWPKFQELDAIERELAVLAAAPDLPESFDTELTQARTARITYAEAVRAAEDRLGQTRREMAEIRVADDLLERAASIRALHADAARYQAALGDLPGVRIERDGKVADATAILRDLDRTLTRETALELNISAARREEINELVVMRQDIATREKDAVEREASLLTQLESARAAREAMPPARDVRGLAEALDELARVGDPEKAVADAERDAAIAAGERDRAFATLGLWTRDPVEIETACVPVNATVAQFERAAAAWDQDRRALDDRMRRLNERDRDRDARRRELERESEVPTEARLAEARRRRDQGWKLVRAAWLDGAGDDETWKAWDGEREPADAFEHAMHDADDAADRLRRDANRVAEASSMDADAERDAFERAECVRAEADLFARRSALDRDWKAAWVSAGIEPLTPAEMREWLDRFQAVRDATRAARDLSERVVRAQIDAGERRARMSAALGMVAEAPGPGETIAAMRERAKRVIEDETRMEKTREIRDAEILGRESDLAEVRGRIRRIRGELATWSRSWRGAVAGLPVGPDAGTTQATAVIERLGKFFEFERDIERFDARIAQMEALIERARDAARDLCEKAGIDPLEVDDPRFAERLVERLEKAQRDDGLRVAAAASEKKDIAACDEARRGLDRALAEIESLRARAGCATPDEIEDIARRAALKRKLAARRDQLRVDLTIEAREADLETLRDEITRDGEPTELDRDIAQRELDDLRREYDELRDEIANARADLRDDAPASRAAQLLEEREHVLAELRDAAQRWRRLRFATHLLAARIETLGDRSRNPVLARAGELFRTLTRGSFEKLGANYGDDPPTIAGFRPASHDPVSVPAMSDGTRDQLWLSLRLAWIAERAAQGLALPIIADDVLVHFDDDRATAALDVLARLSERTQVLLFTHHRHTSELVRALDDDARARVFEHELGG